MSVSKTGGPAFPGVLGESGYGNAARVVHQDGSHSFIEHNQGMSLRDYFAGQALKGVLASPTTRPDASEADLATYVYRMADAMLDERETPQAVAPFDLAAEVERVLASFEGKDRGIPQAHMAAELVAEIRAVIAEKGGV